MKRRWKIWINPSTSKVNDVVKNSYVWYGNVAVGFLRLICFSDAIVVAVAVAVC